MVQSEYKSAWNTVEKVLSFFAIGCSIIFVMLLGARHITSTDIGYHLASGETFFESGTVVDHTPYIYTLPPLDTPESNRPEPGPGNWYDNRGRYRFPNHDWLSQLCIYGSWRLAGEIGLDMLQILLVLGMITMLIISMINNRVHFLLISLSLLLFGLIINFRLNMRPELFGYLCLITQFMMLARLTDQTKKPESPSWFWVGTMMVIQLLYVNFHGYFLLSLAITGSVLTEYLLFALNNRFVDKDMSRYHANMKVVSRLSITLIGIVLVCFINPWGWRLALLPFQTLLYMKKPMIVGKEFLNHSNPWASTLEFRKTIYEQWPSIISDYAFMIMLVLAAVAIVFQLVVLLLKLYQKMSTRGGGASNQDMSRVRWGYLFMIVGMVLVGLQMWRNIAVASLIVIPASLICITDGLHYFSGKKIFGRAHLKLVALASAAVVTLSVYGGFQIINGKLFDADRIYTHFGFGISNTWLPIGAAEWLNEYAPDARIWCDFDISSTLRFFTHPHKELPILTNTWAYPPDVLVLNETYRVIGGRFDLITDRYNIDAVVTRLPASSNLIRQLSSNPDWKMVHVEGFNVLYLRSKGKYGKLAAEHEIRSNSFDINSFVSQQLRKDPSFQRSIIAVADIFADVGEFDLAINVIQEALNYRSPNKKIWEKLVSLYYNRMVQRQEKGDKRFVDDKKQVIYVLEKIIELDPKDQRALETLKFIKSQTYNVFQK
jgi:hypothetical protein